MEHYGNVPGTPDEVGGRVSVPVSCSDQAWKVSGVSGHLPVLASLTDLIYLDSQRPSLTNRASCAVARVVGQGVEAVKNSAFQGAP